MQSFSKRLKKDHFFYFSEKYYEFLEQRKLDLNKDWIFIREVSYLSLEAICCPICMCDSDELILPRILKCHHIYCLPCIVTQFVDVKEYCPVCSERISIQDFKSVQIKTFEPRIGDTLDMVLMQKHPNTFKVNFYKEDAKKKNFLKKIKKMNDKKYKKLLMRDLQIVTENKMI